MVEPNNLSSCFFIFLNTNWNIIMQFNFFSSFFQGQNPEGGNGQDGDFMSEAKDWAGELISGQTGTGRILVSQIRKKKGKSSHTWAVNRYSLTKKLLLSWGHECNYEYEDSFYDIMRKIGIVLVAASCCTIARKGAYCCTHDLSMWWYKMCQIGKGESSMTASPDESCDDDRI